MAAMVRLKTKFNDALGMGSPGEVLYFVVGSTGIHRILARISWDQYADPALIHFFYSTRMPFKVKDSLRKLRNPNRPSCFVLFYFTFILTIIPITGIQN